jgi:hypothetical protein
MPTTILPEHVDNSPEYKEFIEWLSSLSEAEQADVYGYGNATSEALQAYRVEQDAA